ncbi:protein ELC-like [Silene latifolia]|uniref:protein ELC-like n=1 Tax=Silene latifolia TaxID=37657 RepID=UPI003D77A8A3
MTQTAGQSAETLQFLSNILSQRGPSSVPYTEDVKWLIRQHLISLSQTFPSLHINSAIFTHNDGRTVNLLQTQGTIPMIYQNLTYNIPIIIWLVELYPRHPPLVFLNPTREMIIKRPHNHVTPSGMVNVPYLHNWIYPSSNLVDLAKSLGVCFALDPPLYSQRPRNYNSNPNPNPNPNPNANVSRLGLGFGGYGSGRTEEAGEVYKRNANSNPNSNPNANVNALSSIGSRLGLGFGGYGSGSGRTEEAGEVYKRNAINKLVEMVHGDIGGMRKEREGEMDGLFTVQGALRGREERVNRGLKEMVEEKEGLENQLQMGLTNADVLEGWVKENEDKLGKKKVDEVDEVFEPCDVLSKQMIETSASDLAIEDVIYSLDKGVQEGVIPFDQYLKNVRLLSREQFFHRALTAKVRAVQMQARVASMAGRASHYVM